MPFFRAILTSLKTTARVLYLTTRHPRLRVSFSIPSHLTDAERLQLFQLARDKSVVAEIGSYIGASACCLAAAVESNRNGIVCCIDTWRNDSMSEGNRDTWDAFLRNTAVFESRIAPFRGLSTVVSDQVRDYASRIDLLLIDGDHSYEGVKADWECYRNMLGENSIVVFHDYGWAEGVRRVVHEDVVPCVKRYAHLPNMWWGTLGHIP